MPRGSIQTNDSELFDLIEEAKNTGDSEHVNDGTSSNGGQPSNCSIGFYQSNQDSQDGGDYADRGGMMSDLDTCDALSMSFRSVDMHTERRGSIEASRIDEDLRRLQAKRAQKMR